MKVFTHEELPMLFNEWMRRFIEDPTKFQAEFQSVCAFLEAQANGAFPTYGDQCVAMLEKIKAGSAAPASA